MKKILYILLITILLICPFGLVLNVKADPFEISVDDTVSKSELEPESKLIDNTTNIVIQNIGYSNNTFDQFKAYKLLNAYYNGNTNEISYAYTTAFKSFLDTYDQTLANDIGDYFELTSDTAGNIGEINELVSAYAIYISSHNVTGETLTSHLVNNNPVADAQVDVGAYLVLPTSVIDSQLTETNNIPKLIFERSVYGVMIANATISVTDGAWSLSDATIVAKKNTSEVSSVLAKVDIEGWNLDNATSEEITQFLSNVYSDISVDRGVHFSYFFQATVEPEFPDNGNQSILNNATIMNKVKRFEVSIPDGFDYDFYVWDGNAYATKIENGQLIMLANNSVLCDIEQDNNNFIVTNFNTSDASSLFDLKFTDSTRAGDSTIVAKSYYIKDPYYDIDSAITTLVNGGMTQEEALESVMDELIGEITYENTITTYGVKVFATSSDQSIGNITGADYVVCKDINCTEQVSDRFYFSEYNNQIFGSFVGLSGETDYYLKQTKAPTGHKLFTGTIKLLATNSSTTPDASNIALGQNNYYEVTIVNDKNALLPFTDGVGTIVYTVVGLLIIILAISIYMETKKDKAAVVKEEGSAKLD